MFPNKPHLASLQGFTPQGVLGVGSFQFLDATLLEPELGKNMSD